ncbi:MAG: MarR family winged helix-turn-helix transcriptional regulator, partial [Bulleidia sp.]
TMIHRFNRINDEITALYHRAFRKLGFSDSEMVILYMLCDYSHGLTQSDIINVTGMSKQTVNSAISRMVQNGWIMLGERTNHRREIRFTETGEAISRDVIVPFIAAEDHLFEGWTAEEKEQFLLLHQRYRDALSTMVDQLPARQTAAEPEKGGEKN